MIEFEEDAELKVIEVKGAIKFVMSQKYWNNPVRLDLLAWVFPRLMRSLGVAILRSCYAASTIPQPDEAETM